MLHVFNRQVQTAATEIVRQNLQAFNTASGGALMMTNQSNEAGDWMEETMWAAISNLVERRDAYGNGDATVKELQQLLERAVKVDGRVGPIKVTPALMERLGKTTGEAAATLATQAAAGMIQDYLNTTVNVLSVAIGNNTAAFLDKRDATTATTPTLIGMQEACGKFGDAFGDLKCWVMDGLGYNTLLTTDILKNVNTLFNIGNVSIFQDGLGRRFVVTDAPALRTNGANPTVSMLCLASGAAAVKASPLRMYDGKIMGKENVEIILQGEYDFVLGLKGYAWNNTTKANPKNTGDGGAAVSNKGASPSNAELVKPANWLLYASDVKSTAGVMVTFGKKAA